MAMVEASGPIIIFRDAPGLSAREQPSELGAGNAAGDYFRSRERAERAAAKAAKSAAGRRAHQELAQTYALLARRAHEQT
jgi:hypothetical protein